MDARLVTQESVFAACETIAASGRRPSYRSIIEVLGGGSPNDIKEHFNAWRSRDDDAAPESAAEQEPPALPRLLEEMPALGPAMEALASAVLKAATLSAEAMKAEHDEKVRAIEEAAETRVAQIRFKAENELKAARAVAEAEIAALHSSEAALIEERELLLARVRELEAVREASAAEVADLKEANARLAQEQALEREVLTGLGHQLAAAERQAKDLGVELKANKKQGDG